MNFHVFEPATGPGSDEETSVFVAPLLHHGSAVAMFSTSDVKLIVTFPFVQAVGDCDSVTVGAVSSFQTAYKSTVAPFVADKFDTLWEFVYVGVVAVALVDQPLNVYLYFVNPFAVNAFAVPYVCVLLAVLPPVFPFPLYLIVYVFADEFKAIAPFPAPNFTFGEALVLPLSAVSVPLTEYPVYV